MMMRKLSLNALHAKLKILKDIKILLPENGVLIITDIVAKNTLQKKFWNFIEKVLGAGYVEHYTKDDVSELAKEAGFNFSIKHVDDMPKRYNLCVLKK